MAYGYRSKDRTPLTYRSKLHWRLRRPSTPTPRRKVFRPARSQTSSRTKTRASWKPRPKAGLSTASRKRAFGPRTTLRKYRTPQAPHGELEANVTPSSTSHPHRTRKSTPDVVNKIKTTTERYLDEEPSPRPGRSRPHDRSLVPGLIGN